MAKLKQAWHCSSGLTKTLFLLSLYCSMLLCFYFKHLPMPFKHQLAIAMRAKVAICFGLAQRFLLFHLRRRFHQEGAQFP